MPYYLYCLRLRRLVLIFVNPLYECIGVKTSDYFLEAGGFAFEVQLSLTEKGQYAVAYDLSCKKDCHEL
ncbi:hypothetical protein, partial [Neisseria meningitidis]|uniref:hypothetical protein n=1 Tax=Neisseria meningitidis TaxID=487 RepID=UPI0039C879CE